jgi:hypothetical protein
MNPITTSTSTAWRQSPTIQAVTVRSAAPAATVSPSGTTVSLGQAVDAALETYNSRGTLGSGQVRYVWEQDSIDKLSMAMSGALGTSSAASRFQGLGAALLEQLAANGGQRISQSALAVSEGASTEPTLLAMQQANLRKYASNSVTFSLTTASGATVSLGLFSGEKGLAVDANVQGGTLTPEELKGLTALASSFQLALDGLTTEPPKLQLGALSKLDPALFTGLKLDGKVQTSGDEAQTFTLQIGDTTRSLAVKGAAGEVNMNFDNQGGALLGSQAQRQAAVANYLAQFDAARERGKGDEPLMALFKDAFRQLNDVDTNSTRPANHDLPLNKISRTLLSGLADFNASVKQTEAQPNPMRQGEVDKFEYSASQSTTIKGATARLTVEQNQQASLKAAWHESLNPRTPLSLGMDKESQNYRYHAVDDQANSNTRIDLVNNTLVEASASQQASRSERVWTYQNAELQSDTTTASEANQSRDLVKLLDDLFEQDRVARRNGATSKLEQQLAPLRELWSLQADPARISD